MNVKTLGLLALLAVAACRVAEREEPTLYARLGGRPAIEAVVDDFVARVAADDRINHFFRRTDIPRFKGHLADQISEAAGGPYEYEGRTMKAAHRGMRVSDADFDALVEDLVKTLDKFEVPKKEQGELLAVLGPMRGDIVEK